MINKIGKDSNGFKTTPLMTAASNEQFQIVKYLMEKGVDHTIVNRHGWNALHWAVGNKKITDIIKMFLSHMSLYTINKKSTSGATPLDLAHVNDSPIRQEIIDLMRSKGAKRASELERSPTEVETNTTCEIKTLEDQLKTLREIKALEDQLKTLRGQLKRKRDTYDSSNKRQCV